MSNEQDIANIIGQLQRLQIQQSELLVELARLNERNNETETTAAEVSDTPRDFIEGDRVRILNPKRYQARRGIITKIGDSRITVQAADGTKIQRAPHNIVLEE